MESCVLPATSAFQPADMTAVLLVAGIPSIMVVVMIVAAWFRLNTVGRMYSKLEEMKAKATLLSEELDEGSHDAWKLNRELRRKKMELLQVRKDLQTKKIMAQQLTYALEDGGCDEEIMHKLKSMMPEDSGVPELNFDDDDEPEGPKPPIVPGKGIVEFSETIGEESDLNGPAVVHKEPGMQYLRVKLYEAEVPALDLSGSTDTYAKFECGVMELKSSIKMKSLNPVWSTKSAEEDKPDTPGEHYIMGVLQETEGCQKLTGNLAPDCVSVTLCDWDATGDEDIGTVNIPLSDIPGYDDKMVKEPEPQWYDIEVFESMGQKFFNIFTHDQKAADGGASQLWTDLFGGSKEVGGKVVQQESKLAAFMSDVFSNEEELEEKRKANPVHCRVKLAMWFDVEYKEMVIPSVGTLKLDIEKLQVMGSSPGKPRNPYVLMQYQDHWVRLPTAWRQNKPNVKRQLEFAVFEPTSVLTIAVFDEPKERDWANKDELLGKFRVRTSWLPRCKKLDCKTTLLVRDGKVKRKGEMMFSIYYDCPSWIPVIARYAQPALSDHRYWDPISEENELPVHKFHDDAIKEYLDTASPPIHEEAVKELFVEKVPSFDTDVAKANLERLTRALAPLGRAAQWFDDVCTWKSIPHSLFVNFMYGLIIYYPEYMASLGCLSLAGVFIRGYVKNMINWRLPEMDASLFGGYEDDEAEEKKEEDEEEGPGFLAENPLTAVKKKLDELQMMGGNVQVRERAGTHTSHTSHTLFP
eukprot:NODE_61_length_2788_cov_86.621030_g57_i0.p1 GENE.NODE_61_length_2788_cov_86.621030_g57_i0~~NODE_61_length_2788_cov_86.621030_g57_i0.p1  ORF type:complete len:750 (+),score=278.81 NODE_61_length_2788_cov_86.621030_g57_i0:72-2321(+)